MSALELALRYPLRTIFAVMAGASSLFLLGRVLDADDEAAPPACPWL